MKIDMKVLRSAMIVLFGLSALVVAGFAIDQRTSGGQNSDWLAAALVVFVLGALMAFLLVVLASREAMNLKLDATIARGPASSPTANWRGGHGHRPDDPLLGRFPQEAPRSDFGAASTLLMAAMTPSDPLHDVFMATGHEDEELLSYETGEARAGLSVSRSKTRTPDAVATRVLCEDCGTYFQVDVARERPLTITCSGCARAILLRGRHKSAYHERVRCAHCANVILAPTMERIASVQCRACGQGNKPNPLAAPVVASFEIREA
jgi:hypothetical protein